MGAVFVLTERITVALEDAFQHIADPEEREALIAVARLEIARRRRRATQEPTKRCPSCDTTKPASAFGVSRTRYDGLQGWCRVCRSAKARTRRSEMLPSQSVSP